MHRAGLFGLTLSLLAGAREEYYYNNHKYELNDILDVLDDDNIKHMFYQIVYNRVKACYNLPNETFNLSYIKMRHLQNIIKEEYEHYKNISNFILTNAGRQFSASFNPTEYKLSDMYFLNNYDLLQGELRVMFLIIKCKKFPKYLVYHIFRDYYDSKF